MSINFKKIQNITIRYLIFIIGLFILAIGIAMSAKAGIGTSPVSAVPYVLSLKFSVTFGQLTIMMHVIFILLQIILLKKDFPLIQLLQLPIAFIFGYFTDFGVYLVRSVTLTSYFHQFIFTILSIIVVGIGVFVEVKANVVMLAGEGVVKAIALKTKKDFGFIKVLFDTTLVVLAILLSLFFFHTLNGVREGTILAAFLVGSVITFFNKKIKFLDKWVLPVI